MARLLGKTAIITGASGGIGEATAKLFLAEGANVMLVGRSLEKLKATRDRLGAGENIAHAVADAADEDATAAAVAATIKEFDGVDILFANAGTEGWIKPLQEVEMADFEQVLRTNVIGVWLAMKYCVEPMKKRGSGSVIAVTSVAGLVGFSGGSCYIASKHAVCGLVKCAALELGELKIRVNGIAPGPIENRMMRSLEAQILPDTPTSAYEDIKSKNPMKRYGTNEEVAYLAAFLASDESTYCNGGIYTVDGGHTTA